MKQVRPDGVIIGDQVFLPADIVVWASGVRVHDQVAQWNVPQGRGGRIAVDDHLRVDGLSGVFAVDDIAAEGGDRALPQLAQPARQGGRYVAAQLPAMLAGRQVTSFEHHDKGTLATIGRNSAVAQVKGLPRLTGVLAWVIWIAVHVFSLLGNRNRFATMLNLSARYLFWHRSHNAIVGETPTILLDQGRTETVHTVTYLTAWQVDALGAAQPCRRVGAPLLGAPRSLDISGPPVHRFAGCSGWNHSWSEKEDRPAASGG